MPRPRRRPGFALRSYRAPIRRPAAPRGSNTVPRARPIDPSQPRPAPPGERMPFSRAQTGARALGRAKHRSARHPSAPPAGEPRAAARAPSLIEKMIRLSARRAKNSGERSAPRIPQMTRKTKTARLSIASATTTAVVAPSQSHCLARAELAAGAALFLRARGRRGGEGGAATPSAGGRGVWRGCGGRGDWERRGWVGSALRARARPPQRARGRRRLPQRRAGRARDPSGCAVRPFAGRRRARRRPPP